MALKISSPVLIFYVLLALTVCVLSSAMGPLYHLALPPTPNSTVGFTVSFVRVENRTAFADGTVAETHTGMAAARHTPHTTAFVTSFAFVVMASILCGFATFKSLVWLLMDPTDALLTRRVCVLTGVATFFSLVPLALLHFCVVLPAFCAQAFSMDFDFDAGGTWTAAAGLVGLRASAAGLLLTFSYLLINYKMGWYAKKTVKRHAA